MDRLCVVLCDSIALGVPLDECPPENYLFLLVWSLPLVESMFSERLFLFNVSWLVSKRIGFLICCCLAVGICSLEDW